jgi:hypothetical protein
MFYNYIIYITPLYRAEEILTDKLVEMLLSSERKIAFAVSVSLEESEYPVA